MHSKKIYLLIFVLLPVFLFLFASDASAAYDCSLGGSYADLATCNTNCSQTANCSVSSTVCIFNTSQFNSCTFAPTAPTYSCPLAGGSACNGSNQCTRPGTCTYVAPVPPVTISAHPTTIISGNSSTLSWSSTNATTCTASGSWTGSKSTSGSQTVSPTRNSTYTLTCTGPGGSANRSATVTVNAAAPAVSFSA